MMNLLEKGLRYEGKSTFREWIELEELKNRIAKAAEESSGTFPDEMFDFLSAAFALDRKDFQEAYWSDCITLFMDVCKANYPKVKLPFLEASPDKHKHEPWEYEKRLWNLYSHMLAKMYGWTLEYIGDLKVDEALGKIQEILIDDQLEHEFQWSLSDRAFSYDSNTKTSKPNPLPRPYWMQEKLKGIKKFKIPKGLLPVGNVDYSTIDEENRPKEINAL
jgi:hypothetical protein